jgi:hypothetical protein
VQRIVQHEQLAVHRPYKADAIVECHSNTALTLRRLTIARMIDQNAPHDLRRDTEELRAVAPRYALLSQEPDVRFVHERRRLQRMVPTLAPQKSGGPLPKLLVHQWDQFFPRPKIPAAPSLQQLTDGPGVCGLHVRCTECVAPPATHHCDGRVVDGVDYRTP